MVGVSEPLAIVSIAEIYSGDDNTFGNLVLNKARLRALKLTVAPEPISTGSKLGIPGFGSGGLKITGATNPPVWQRSGLVSA